MGTTSEITKKHHVFFWYHDNDQRWAWVARTRMETCHPRIKCFCCSEVKPENDQSAAEWISTKIKSSIFTVIIISRLFLMDEWIKLEHYTGHSDNDNTQIISSDTSLLTKHSVICLLVEDVGELPSLIQQFTIIKVEQRIWWTELITALSSQDRINLLENSTHSKDNGTSENHGVRNGTLICSLKSQPGNCGQEQVDLAEMPAELRSLRLRLSRREYQNVLAYLMSAANFRFRFWCSNLPLTVFVFSSLLALCLTIIPVVEVRLYGAQADGMEYLHAVIVWVAILSVFLLTSHAMRRKRGIVKQRRLNVMYTGRPGELKIK